MDFLNFRDNTINDDTFIKEINTKLDKYDETIQKQLSTFTEITTNIGKLKTYIDELKNKITNLEQKTKELNSKQSDTKLQTQIDNLTEIKNKLKEKLIRANGLLDQITGIDLNKINNDIKSLIDIKQNSVVLGGKKRKTNKKNKRKTCKRKSCRRR